MKFINVQKMIKFLSLFVMVTALAAMVSCASTRKQEGTGQYIDDSVITTKVKAAILHEPGLKVAEINVETYKGIVQLSGFVSDGSDVAKAEKVTREVKGVVSVKNDIRVK